MPNEISIIKFYGSFFIDHYHATYEDFKLIGSYYQRNSDFASMTENYYIAPSDESNFTPSTSGSTAPQKSSRILNLDRLATKFESYGRAQIDHIIHQELIKTLELKLPTEKIKFMRSRAKYVRGFNDNKILNWRPMETRANLAPNSNSLSAILRLDGAVKVLGKKFSEIEKRILAIRDKNVEYYHGIDRKIKDLKKRLNHIHREIYRDLGKPLTCFL